MSALTPPAPRARPALSAPTPSGGPSALGGSSGSASFLSPELGVNLAPGRLLGGRYRVEGLIGQGGMGKVYRAVDVRLERVVVVKVAHGTSEQSGDEAARFRREALKMAALKHPNVVAIYDYNEADGVEYLVMEWVSGHMIKEELRARASMAPERFADLLAQLLAGLDAAHARGVIHRDIKPSNLMWDAEARLLKILDFGLARGVEGDTLTSTGQAHGSVQYMAPEQIRGDAQDPRTDIYAVGVLAFLLLTGELPFSGENTVELMFQKLQRAAPPLLSRLPAGVDWVPPALAEVVDACLCVDPAGRPRDAAECAARLAPSLALLRGASALTRLPTPRARLAPSEAREAGAGARGVPVAAVAALTALLGLAAGGGVVWALVRPAPAPAPASVSLQPAPLAPAATPPPPPPSPLAPGAPSPAPWSPIPSMPPRVESLGPPRGASAPPLAPTSAGRATGLAQGSAGLGGAGEGTAGLGGAGEGTAGLGGAGEGSAGQGSARLGEPERVPPEQLRPERDASRRTPPQPKPRSKPPQRKMSPKTSPKTPLRSPLKSPKRPPLKEAAPQVPFIED
ncbi:MAG: hypothetical protein FJ138_01660 [Deltaproteobacteria bacterium]|nr:hypothetical protein [Deltaproteobacteria bacterium]